MEQGQAARVTAEPSSDCVLRTVLPLPHVLGQPTKGRFVLFFSHQPLFLSEKTELCGRQMTTLMPTWLRHMEVSEIPPLSATVTKKVLQCPTHIHLPRHPCWPCVGAQSLLGVECGDETRFLWPHTSMQKSGCRDTRFWEPPLPLISWPQGLARLSQATTRRSQAPSTLEPPST